MLFGLFGRHTKRYRPPLARERLGRRLVRSFVRVFLTVLVVAALTAAGWGGWLLYNFLYVSEYFDLADLDIELQPGPGLDTEPNPEFLVQDLRNRLHEAGLDQGNLLRLDTQAVRDTVRAHSKVQSVAVRKHFPRRLTVKAELRQVVAVVLHDPLLAIDRDGVVVQALSTRSVQARRFPYITGIELGPVELGQCAAKSGSGGASADLTKALRLLSSLRVGASALAGKISEIHCDGATGDLSLVLLGGTEVRFGSGDPLLKMPSLETFLRNQKGEPEQNGYIDLRVEGIVTSKAKTAATQGEGK